MSTPYNSGQNPNEPYGRNSDDPSWQNPYGTAPEHAPEHAREYGAEYAQGENYGGYHEQLQPEYASREAGYPGYGMAGAYQDQQTTYGYTPAPAQQQKNGLALAAMILGIIGLLGILTIVGGFIFGLIALILGIVGLRKADKITGPGARRGMAISGIVMGAIALVISTLMLIFSVNIAKQLIDDGVVDACQNLEPGSQEQQQCLEDEIDRSLNGTSEK